jgi:hypothetical protein
VIALADGRIVRDTRAEIPTTLLSPAPIADARAMTAG